MARISLRVETRYWWKSELYVVREELIENRFRVENLSAGGQHIVTYPELVVLWEQGELRFELPKNSNVKTELPQSPPTEYTFSDFGSLDETVREESWRRYKLLLPLVKLAPKERTRAAITQYATQQQTRFEEGLRESGQPGPGPGLAQTRRTQGKRANLGQALSASSLEKWLRAFVNSGYDIRSLVPRTKYSGGKGVLRLKAETEAVLERVFQKCEKDRHYRTVEDVVALLTNAIADENRYRAEGEKLTLPSRATVYRRIEAKKLHSLLKRPPTPSEKHAQLNVGVGPRPTQPLERVEIDHTLLDLFVVDEEDRLPIGRPTLTVALDIYTGFPFGCYVGFEPPGYGAVQHCLLHGILPKPDAVGIYGTTNPWPVFGLPQTLVVDNGKEFVGRDLSEACAQLGIELLRTPPRQPWFKGSIERHFRTLNTGLVHPLPGTTFSNIIERGDYDPAKHACISLSVFWRILHIFLLDIYAQRWHTGLKGVPAKRWAESIQSGFRPALTHSAEEVKILLYRTGERTIQPTGLNFESLRYQHPQFARLRSQLESGTKVRFKYDAADLSIIYICDPTALPGQSKWLPVKAVDEEYARGLSLWKHQIIRSFVLQEKGEVDVYALAEAKERIQKAVMDEFNQTRQSQGRKKAARFLGVQANTTTTTGDVSVSALSSRPTQMLPLDQMPLAPANLATPLGEVAMTATIQNPPNETELLAPPPLPLPISQISTSPKEVPSPLLTGLEVPLTKPVEVTKASNPIPKPTRTKKTRPKEKEVNTDANTEAEDEDAQIKPSGWGGDYNLPRPSSQRKAGY